MIIYGVSFPVLSSSIVTSDSRMADAKGEEVVLTVTDVSCVPEVGCYTYFELMFTHKLVRTPPATFIRGILCSKPPNSGILKSVGPRGPL